MQVLNLKPAKESKPSLCIIDVFCDTVLAPATGIPMKMAIGRLYAVRLLSSSGIPIQKETDASKADENFSPPKALCM